MPKNEPTAPAEPTVSLNTYLARGARVSAAQRALLTTLHGEEKHTTPEWTALAQAVLTREVNA